MRNLIKINSAKEAKKNYSGQWLIKVTGKNRFNLEKGIYINPDYIQTPVQNEKGVTAICY